MPETTEKIWLARTNCGGYRTFEGEPDFDETGMSQDVFERLTAGSVKLKIGQAAEIESITVKLKKPRLKKPRLKKKRKHAHAAD